MSNESGYCVEGNIVFLILYIGIQSETFDRFIICEVILYVNVIVIYYCH